jgi:DNA repair photolyase
MNLSEQEEVVFLLKYNTIVSFSTLYCRPTFPPGTSRVLNRMWKSSEVRSLGVPYWLFSRPMLLTQIKMAKKLGKKAVFLSTEGRRRLWLKRWLKEAIKDHKEWTLMSGMRQVCLGNKRECWQNVAYLPLENHYNFHLPEITMKQWEELESSKL